MGGEWGYWLTNFATCFTFAGCTAAMHDLGLANHDYLGSFQTMLAQGMEKDPRRVNWTDGYPLLERATMLIPDWMGFDERIRARHSKFVYNPSYPNEYDPEALKPIVDSLFRNGCKMIADVVIDTPRLQIQTPKDGAVIKLIKPTNGYEWKANALGLTISPSGTAMTVTASSSVQLNNLTAELVSEDESNKSGPFWSATTTSAGTFSFTAGKYGLIVTNLPAYYPNGEFKGPSFAIPINISSSFGGDFAFGKYFVRIKGYEANGTLVTIDSGVFDIEVYDDYSVISNIVDTTVDTNQTVAKFSATVVTNSDTAQTLEVRCPGAVGETQKSGSYPLKSSSTNTIIFERDRNPLFLLSCNAVVKSTYTNGDTVYSQGFDFSIKRGYPTAPVISANVTNDTSTIFKISIDNFNAHTGTTFPGENLVHLPQEIQDGRLDYSLTCPTVAGFESKTGLLDMYNINEGVFELDFGQKISTTPGTMCTLSVTNYVTEWKKTLNSNTVSLNITGGKFTPKTLSSDATTLVPSTDNLSVDTGFLPDLNSLPGYTSTVKITCGSRIFTIDVQNGVSAVINIPREVDNVSCTAQTISTKNSDITAMSTRGMWHLMLASVFDLFDFKLVATTATSDNSIIEGEPITFEIPGFSDVLKQKIPTTVSPVSNIVDTSANLAENIFNFSFNRSMSMFGIKEVLMFKCGSTTAKNVDLPVGAKTYLLPTQNIPADDVSCSTYVVSYLGTPTFGYATTTSETTTKNITGAKTILSTIPKEFPATTTPQIISVSTTTVKLAFAFNRVVSKATGMVETLNIKCPTNTANAYILPKGQAFTTKTSLPVLVNDQVCTANIVSQIGSVSQTGDTQEFTIKGTNSILAENIVSVSNVSVATSTSLSLYNLDLNFSRKLNVTDNKIIDTLKVECPSGTIATSTKLIISSVWSIKNLIRPSADAVCSAYVVSSLGGSTSNSETVQFNVKGRSTMVADLTPINFNVSSSSLMSGQTVTVSLVDIPEQATKIVAQASGNSVTFKENVNASFTDSVTGFTSVASYKITPWKVTSDSTFNIILTAYDSENTVLSTLTKNISVMKMPSLTLVIPASVVTRGSVQVDASGIPLETSTRTLTISCPSGVTTSPNVCLTQNNPVLPMSFTVVNSSATEVLMPINLVVKDVAGNQLDSINKGVLIGASDVKPIDFTVPSTLPSGQTAKISLTSYPVQAVKINIDINYGSLFFKETGVPGTHSYTSVSAFPTLSYSFTPINTLADSTVEVTVTAIDVNGQYISTLKKTVNVTKMNSLIVTTPDSISSGATAQISFSNKPTETASTVITLVCPAGLSSTYLYGSAKVCPGTTAKTTTITNNLALTPISIPLVNTTGTDMTFGLSVLLKDSSGQQIADNYISKNIVVKPGVVNDISLTIPDQVQNMAPFSITLLSVPTQANKIRLSVVNKSSNLQLLATASTASDLISNTTKDFATPFTALKPLKLTAVYKNGIENSAGEIQFEDTDVNFIFEALDVNGNSLIKKERSIHVGASSMIKADVPVENESGVSFPAKLSSFPAEVGQVKITATCNGISLLGSVKCGTPIAFAKTGFSTISNYTFIPNILTGYGEGTLTITYGAYNNVLLSQKTYTVKITPAKPILITAPESVLSGTTGSISLDSYPTGAATIKVTAICPPNVVLANKPTCGTTGAVTYYNKASVSPNISILRPLSFVATNKTTTSQKITYTFTAYPVNSTAAMETKTVEVMITK
ncbi:MAG: hypothetical protein WCF94_02070 [bacterium]